MRISDWSSDVCSSDLSAGRNQHGRTFAQDDHGRQREIAKAVPQHSERSAQTRLAHCDMRYEKAAIMFGQAFAERCILCNETGVMPAPGGFQVQQLRSEERSGGKGGVSTCRSRWSPEH